MPRPVSVPKLCLHKASGKAVVRLNGRDHYLGVFGTPEAKADYDRLIAEWLANGRRVAQDATGSKSGISSSISVNEVLVLYWRHAERHYRHPDGSATTEIAELRRSLRPLRDLYGLTPAYEFGPKRLAALRQVMIEGGLCRTLINRRLDRIKRVFKWAASEELVPVTVFESLRTLPGLRRGRTDARESDPVKPVDPVHVAATLPHLNRQQRAMVELQRSTGMRPGEVCKLTLVEIDRIGEPWLYRPSEHKTSHHGKERVIPFGPKARAALVAFLIGHNPPPDGFAGIDLTDDMARLVAADAYQEADREKDAVLLRDLARPIVLVAGCVVDPAAPLFSPKEAREERFRVARRNRKSKVTPSQVNRRKAKPKLNPAPVYVPTSYAHAVAKAAARAGVPHWHPNQLRHTFGTEVRRAYGLEAAQVLLGHSRADVTQVYAERNLTLAARVANEIG